MDSDDLIRWGFSVDDDDMTQRNDKRGPMVTLRNASLAGSDARVGHDHPSANYGNYIVCRNQRYLEKRMT